MVGVEIRYGNIAPKAKESMIVTVTEKENFVKLSDFQKYNLKIKNSRNPIEYCSVALDGTVEPLPSAPELYNMGYWSEQLSDENGIFKTPIVFTFDGTGQKEIFTSDGLTFSFDVENQIYPNEMTVEWFSGEELLSTITATLTQAFYYLENKVDGYNKIVLTISRLNTPLNRLKLTALDYGFGTVFTGKELSDVKIIQEIDPISTTLPINTVDFTIITPVGTNYTFQEHQPVDVYFDGNLKQKAFIKEFDRTAERRWNIKAEDWIGILATKTFEGGVYGNVSASSLIGSIFNLAKIPWKMEATNDSVEGYIPYGNARDALQLICFACNFYVDVSEHDVVKIKKYVAELPVSQEIPRQRIMEGQKIVKVASPYEIVLTSHAYDSDKKITDTINDYELIYRALDEDIGKTITAIPAVPIYAYRATNNDEDIQYITVKPTMIKFTVLDDFRLYGLSYSHYTLDHSVQNPNVRFSNEGITLKIDKATTVTKKNAENILSHIKDWLFKDAEISVKIIEGKHISGGDYYAYGQAKYNKIKYGEKIPKIVTYDQPVHLGDIITVETEYSGYYTGMVYRQEYNLNGAIIVKDVLIR